MNIIPFKFNNNEIRTITKDGEPWFVAKDVCGVLEISKYRDATARLDDDERGSVLLDTLGGKQEVSIINESGLYSLTLTSRKPQAKPFKKWVTSEVLPSIRKTGSYSVKPMSQMEIVVASAQALLKVEQEQARLAEEQEVIKERLDNMDGDTGYMTVLAYCRKNDLSCSKSEANTLGRKAGSACRALGVRIGKVPDERWGEVNSYPIGVLDKVAESIGL